MSGRKGRKRRPHPAPRRETATKVEAEETVDRARSPRRPGLFGSTFLAPGESSLPPLGRSLGRGLLAVATQPALLAVTFVLVAAAWLGLLALGFEGTPGRLVDVLALVPISTYFDLGTGASLYGVGPSFLVFVGISIVVRTIVYSVLAGAILEAVEDGRVTRYGVLRGLGALPTMFVVQLASFSLIIAGNLVLPVLGGGIGFLAFISALVAGLFFLGFAPTAAIREGRPALETVRRSGRAAMLPGGRHLVLCALYFFLALPVVVGLAPGGTDITANPNLTTWIFVLVVTVLHLAFMATFAYRWIVAEADVPDEPVRRRASVRAPKRAPSAGARGRR